MSQLQTFPRGNQMFFLEESRQEESSTTQPDSLPALVEFHMRTCFPPPPLCCYGMSYCIQACGRQDSSGFACFWFFIPSRCTNQKRLGFPAATAKMKVCSLRTFFKFCTLHSHSSPISLCLALLKFLCPKCLPHTIYTRAGTSEITRWPPPPPPHQKEKGKNRKMFSCILERVMMPASQVDCSK